jgi:GNAT superfamily N-acetyltransferase
MLEYFPVTAERWGDLERLFEGHGNPGYCWCTFWRISSTEYDRLNSRGRKQALKGMVETNEPIGILAYQNQEPVAWCSIAPRESYGRLERSRTIKRIDDLRTWSIVCFYLSRHARRQGVALGLVRASVEYARSMGAEVVESYPVEPKMNKKGELDYGVSYRYMGYVSTFKKAGFKDITPIGGKRWVMRYIIKKEA